MCLRSNMQLFPVFCSVRVQEMVGQNKPAKLGGLICPHKNKPAEAIRWFLWSQSSSFVSPGCDTGLSAAYWFIFIADEAFHSNVISKRDDETGNKSAACQQLADVASVYPPVLLILTVCLLRVWNSGPFGNRLSPLKITGSLGFHTQTKR